GCLGPGDDVVAVSIAEPVPISVVDRVVLVVAVQHYDDGRAREGVDRQAHGVDGAEAGFRYEQHEVGRDRRCERHVVAVGGDRRPRAARAFDQADVDAVGPTNLADQITDGEGWRAERVGRHRRRERPAVPAMWWADVVGRLAGRAREHVGVGGPVAGLQRLRGPASADTQSGVAGRGQGSMPSVERMTPTAVRAAAVSAGESAVVKMYERARFTISSVRWAGPATKPPRAPTVFDSVPMRSASRPVRSGSGPRTACA